MNSLKMPSDLPFSEFNLDQTNTQLFNALDINKMQTFLSQFTFTILKQIEKRKDF